MNNNEQPQSNRFNFCGKSVHLTYRDFQDHEALKQFIKTQLGYNGKEDQEVFDWWSIVHEEGHEDTPYQHTHCAFGLRTKRHIRNERLFDFNGIHPNIKPLNSLVHQRRTWTYHEKAPISLSRSDRGPGGIIAQSNMEREIKQHRSLFDACHALGIEIRTVSDVKALRADKPRPEPYVHKYSNSEWSLPLRTDFKCLFVYGPSGTGKTQWALHCFTSPLLVSHLDDLGDFDPQLHDGIVFDDMRFAHLPLQAAIHLTDWDEARSIHIRYKTAVIPAYTRKIFTSNFEFKDVFPEDPHGAIRRRVPESAWIKVSGPTFTNRTIAGTAEEEAEGSAIEEEDWHELLEIVSQGEGGGQGEGGLGMGEGAQGVPTGELEFDYIAPPLVLPEDYEVDLFDDEIEQYMNELLQFN